MTALGLPVEERELQRLLAYLGLLQKWNRVFNLTAVRSPEEMVTRHLLDSLATRPFLLPGSLVDVGSGAGLPGIPIAITEPQRPVVLLETVAKKVRFLRQVVVELDLANVSVHQGRVESYHPPQPFATVISRAFASISDFLGCAGHLCAPGGSLLAMKGRHPVAELERLPPGYRLVVVQRLAFPGLGAERHLVRIVREATD